MRAFSDNARGHGLTKECLELARALSSCRSKAAKTTVADGHKDMRDFEPRVLSAKSPDPRGVRFGTGEAIGGLSRHGQHAGGAHKCGWLWTCPEHQHFNGTEMLPDGLRRGAVELNGDRLAHLGGCRMEFRWTVQLPPHIGRRDAPQKASELPPDFADSLT